MRIVFETHSTTEDNEAGRATGWLPGRLSALGREQARQLGERRRNDGLSAVVASDLQRAVDTAVIAFGDTDIPLIYDWRLRECNYGTLNGAPADTVHRERGNRVREPYPGGESWEEAIRRVHNALMDLRKGRHGHRVLLIGHVATRWALDHYLAGRELAELVDEDFEWRPGWEYDLP